jgi:NTE family protein
VLIARRARRGLHHIRGTGLFRRGTVAIIAGSGEKLLAFEWQRRSRNGDRGASASPDEPATAPARPTIGLALGGGGARGFAHIGVIRTLVANGIKPDVIVGTSIGAVVGGCYAAGRLDVLEQWARGLTRRGLLSYLDISLSGSGLIGGDRLAARLEETLGDSRIETLPLRFATITTEVGTGHEIWLTRGRVVDAVRASYALPGIFPPVALDGRWLVDGALVNPVPVSAARVFGSRLVIAVNLNSDVLGRSITMAGETAPDDDGGSEPDASPPRRGLRAIFSFERSLRRQFMGGARRPGLPTVMVDAFNVMQDRITRARLAGDPPDVALTPRLGHIGWFDFHRAQEAIDVGARATERSLELIDEAITALAPRPAAAAPPAR